jgi:hypothetical protein
MSHFSNHYQGGSAGPNYAYMTMGSEDDIFFLGAKNTQWRQRWSKYTPHQGAMIVQPLANQGKTLFKFETNRFRMWSHHECFFDQNS